MRIHIILMATLLLGACRPVVPSAPQPPKNPSAEPVEFMTATPDTQLEKTTALVVDDLSTRLSLSPEKIVVLSAEYIVWTDSSLGCPHSGETYTQQAIPGYLVNLRADDQEYVYHTDTDQRVILCTNEELPSIPVTPGEIDDDQPWMPVD